MFITYKYNTQCSFVWKQISSAHWFRNGKIDQQFKNSKNIDFRENIVKQEMSIYAKAKSVLICTINVWPLLHLVWRIFRGFILIITVKLQLTVLTPKEEFNIFKFQATLLICTINVWPLLHVILMYLSRSQ